MIRSSSLNYDIGSDFFGDSSSPSSVSSDEGIELSPLDAYTRKLRVEIELDPEDCTINSMQALEVVLGYFCTGYHSNIIQELQGLKELLGEERLRDKKYLAIIIPGLLELISKYSNDTDLDFIIELGKIFDFGNWNNEFLAFLVTKVREPCMSGWQVMKYITDWSRITVFSDNNTDLNAFTEKVYDTCLTLAPDMYGAACYRDFFDAMIRMMVGRRISILEAKLVAQYFGMQVCGLHNLMESLISLYSSCTMEEGGWQLIIETICSKKFNVVQIEDVLPFLFFVFVKLEAGIEVKDDKLLQIFENKFNFRLGSEKLDPFLKLGCVDSVHILLNKILELSLKIESDVSRANAAGIVSGILLLYLDLFEENDARLFLSKFKEVLGIGNTSRQVKKMVFGVLMQLCVKKKEKEGMTKVLDLFELGLIDKSYLSIVVEFWRVGTPVFEVRFGRKSSFIEIMALLMGISQREIVLRIGLKLDYGYDTSLIELMSELLNHGNCEKKPLTDNEVGLIKQIIRKLPDDWSSKVTVLRSLFSIEALTADLWHNCLDKLLEILRDDTALKNCDYHSMLSFFVEIRFLFEKALFGSYQLHFDWIIICKLIYDKALKKDRGLSRDILYPIIEQSYNVIANSVLEKEAARYIAPMFHVHYEHEGATLVREGKKIKCIMAKK